MAISTNLQDKVALVTGASTGIGRGVALALADCGCHVFINYPEPAERENAAAVLQMIKDRGGSGALLQDNVSAPMEGMYFYDAWWLLLPDAFYATFTGLNYVVFRVGRSQQNEAP